MNLTSCGKAKKDELVTRRVGSSRQYEEQQSGGGICRGGNEPCIIRNAPRPIGADIELPGVAKEALRNLLCKSKRGLFHSATTAAKKKGGQSLVLPLILLKDRH